MSRKADRTARGRGSQIRPANRFGGPSYEDDFEQLESDPEGLDEHLVALRNLPTEYLPDHSRSVVSRNDSPDIPFTYSLNPYRGCQHGCSYCYARPTHEYLGWDAGLDFEAKILVKEDAPDLLRAFLSRPGWVPEPIVMSGVTDPYQPGERRFRITRRCLEVMAEFRQPVSIITKNALILRDRELLEVMASENLVHVNVSMTTLQADLSRSMEPRTSIPSARLRAIRALSELGVPVRVLIAPVIPGLNDSEIPAILQSARESGATDAGFQILRLPLAVAPIFQEWLGREQPGRQAKVEQRIRTMRDGRLNSVEFGKRMRGEGEMARRIGDVFRLFARKYGLDGGLPPHDSSRFRSPTAESDQLWLF
ncbi:PA0069 family radical SAM protein [Tautonia marina]|uniref:PA0069 family radical SAM protein n=1 Tax=Tautonia marina TaxID=2653855 RepID=UPI0012605CA4|nr:PA0069 family radical SAM protein [Tautonia marina]